MSKPGSRIVAIVALAGWFGLAGCDALTSTETRISRAGTALEQGRHEAALQDARVVVEKHPERADGWLLMARIGLKTGDAQSALRDLERAAAAGAGSEDVRPLRDTALLQAGRFDELVKQSASAPDEKLARAKALVGLERMDEARPLVQQILSAEPRHAGARLFSVRLLYSQGQNQEARAALDSLLTDTPAFAEGWLQQARFALAEGDAAAALTAFEKADALALAQLTLPEQAELLVALIEVQLRLNKTEEAPRTLARLKALVQQSPVTEYLSARISMAQGDAATAVAILQRSLGKDPTHGPSRLLLGAALIEQGSVEQARNQLNNLIGEQPENMEARKLLAQLHVSQGDSAAAEKVLAELPENVTADPTADWMRSAILAMSGDRAESLAVLEQAARASPANVPLQQDLARSYLLAGRPEDAARVLDGISTRISGLAGKQLQVLTQIQGKPNDQVPGLLKQIIAARPEDAELRTVAGQFLLRLGDAPAAAEQFRSALAASPDLVEARLGLAGVALRQAQLPEAAAQLEQVIAARPDTEAAYMGLAAIAIRQNQLAQARKWLEQAVGAIPATATARIGLAELSYREGQLEQADALLRQAVTVARDKRTVMLRAGDIQLRAGQAAKAEALFAQVHTQHPSGPSALRLFVARKALKQSAPEVVLRQWLQRQPEDAAVRTALAYHLVEQNSLREAISEYERLTTGDAPPVLLNNLAWAYQKTGNPRAEATARAAYGAAPANPAIADTLGWILLENGKADEALPLLEKAAAGLPDNADVQANLKRARELVEK